MSKRRMRKSTTRSGPAIEVRDPPASSIEAPVRHPGQNGARYWPDDVPMPDVWHKPRSRQLACPQCRCWFLPGGSQAVVCQSSGAEIAWFRCRACGHRWCLPIATG